MYKDVSFEHIHIIITHTKQVDIIKVKVNSWMDIKQRCVYHWGLHITFILFLLPQMHYMLFLFSWCKNNELTSSKVV